MFKTIKADLPASLVVFFVALPLCLGIALASGAPLFSGIIAGIIGGIVVGAISGSSIGVSGPAAGLAVVVLTAIADLGSYELFLVAVVLAGLMQILLGVLKAGVIGYFFPSSVIKGMLSAIGIIIFLKQIPLALGYEEGETPFAFFETTGLDIFRGLVNMVSSVHPGVVLVTTISLVILLVWDKVLAKKHKAFKLIPGPLVAVIAGIIYQLFFNGSGSTLEITGANLVSVPIPENVSDFIGQFTFPDFSQLGNTQVYMVAITIAIVASLETLLSVEATDKLDPAKRVTPTNRELVAQGVGNTFSGLVGGLPITQVIVRSTANVMSGGKSKVSSIIHGFLLLFSVILIPRYLNLIPLGVLAAVLLIIGYKLANPKQFLQMSKLGKSQFIPFLVTVIAIVATDLLVGILLGLAVGIITILINSYKNSHFLHIEDKSNGVHRIKMELAEEVTFLNKGAIQRELNALPENSYVTLDVRKTRSLDLDILEILDDFAVTADRKNITMKLISERGEVENPKSYREFFGVTVFEGAH
ncbi:SulP family inorganic anion transporter [Antarcticibacterium arcticum]|uniref:SulP family inorganic anion transporter n=1 Tax=Antarcticibacterium arcticum TaxID=2585771 RepID=A0A5B8YLD2_9FLAO|nr:SulP family inorganic anion transporter [Antarcticibacterium arcticum]QED38534.1 SulP family inorganic anion transporter [Antarcticibacterium arcticum]